MAVTVSILGSTGSIGCQTLDIIRQHPDAFDVKGLTAHTNAARLFEQCLEFEPEDVVCVDEQAAGQLRVKLAEVQCKVNVHSGLDALVELAKDGASDVVVAAIVGAVGLPSCYAAVCAGKRVLLANKESLVMAGRLFMDAVIRHQATLLPVDSEHNALFQCMPDEYLPGIGQPAGVEGIILTASGGPFLHTPLADFAGVTPEQAVAHPNWSMGAKISVDSATMMNKGLEVIEAHWLFGFAANDIEVVVHPQSVVHSLLRYCDGSVLAECGVPDMRTPIAHCLAWPGRLAVNVKRLDLIAVGQLEFIAADFVRFPCLKLAYQALTAGAAASIVLNIANEIAVNAFLANKISYTEIATYVEQQLNQLQFANPSSIDDILDIENEIRQINCGSRP